MQDQINMGTSKPIKHTPRRFSSVQRKMEEAVAEMKKQELVEKLNRTWSSGVVQVRKKNGSLRFCISLQAVSAITFRDTYRSCVGFSTLDLKSNQYQVEMAEKDREQTVFSFGQELWQFKIMPHGLCNAPTTFKHLTERVLDDLQWRMALVYLNGVILYGPIIRQRI